MTSLEVADLGPAPIVGDDRDWSMHGPRLQKLAVVILGLIPLFGAWKKAIARRGLLRMYRQAMARTRGQPTRGKLTSPVGLQPEELLSIAVDSLADMDGAERAARLLGLTTGEVAVHLARARQIHIRIHMRLRGLC
jgi:hypothetical protein